MTDRIFTIYNETLSTSMSPGVGMAKKVAERPQVRSENNNFCFIFPDAFF